ncbi:MAG: hypothetical protein WD871_08420 [Xanthobacteraceae bacterium]
MAIVSEEIPCNFVGEFKVGDNLVFNAGLLRSLVDANNDGTFNKLIVLQAGAIVEAALGQIIYRAKNHTREGVPEMSEEDRSAIEGKKADNFNNIIGVMKKHKLLDELGADIYDELHKLRKYRNKVHIYLNIEIEGVSKDEGIAFSKDICNWALKLNVRILKYLSNKRPRPKELHQYVSSLVVPNPA